MCTWHCLKIITDQLDVEMGKGRNKIKLVVYGKKLKEFQKEKRQQVIKKPDKLNRIKLMFGVLQMKVAYTKDSKLAIMIYDNPKLRNLKECYRTLT